MRPAMVRILFCTAAALLLGAACSPLSAQTEVSYAAATLAPSTVTVPPVVLEDADLHAMLVELAGGADPATIGSRLGLDAAEQERLFGLAEVEALGRRTPQGWVPLALALDEAGVGRLTEFAAGLASAIADSLQARWAWLDSAVAELPLTGRLPLSRTGHLLLGGYLLGLFQADAFWQAGLAPSDRPYAFRVYRVPPIEAPCGHNVSAIGSGGWAVDRFAVDRRAYGLIRLADPTDPLTAELVGGQVGAEAAGGLLESVLTAYRAWYVLEREPAGTTLLLLQRLEAVDAEGRARIPLISDGDRVGMRAIAAALSGMLWPVLQDALPGIGDLAAELGYGDPRLLGEVTLWTWERSVQIAVDLLVERGLLLAPLAGRSQALLLPQRP